MPLGRPGDIPCSSAHGPRAARTQGSLGQRSQAQGGILWGGRGLVQGQELDSDNPCGSLHTQGIYSVVPCKRLSQLFAVTFHTCPQPPPRRSAQQARLYPPSRRVRARGINPGAGVPPAGPCPGDRSCPGPRDGRDPAHARCAPVPPRLARGGAAVTSRGARGVLMCPPPRARPELP